MRLPHHSSTTSTIVVLVSLCTVVLGILNVFYRRSPRDEHRLERVVVANLSSGRVAAVALSLDGAPSAGAAQKKDGDGESKATVEKKAAIAIVPPPPSNHHRSWPRVCKKPGHLPPDYVRIVEAMRKRQQTESIQTHTRLQSDPLVTGGSHSGGKATVGELAHLQACLYQTVDAWAELARQEKIRWAACGGTLFGAMCYHSMPLWDDDIDITVPPSDCKLLDRIWEKATPVGSDSWPRPRDDGWEPRRLHHLNLTVWKTSKGAAATNFHRCRNPCFSS